MLKRSKKIRQYTSLLKAKRAKQLQLKNHQVLQYKLDEQPADQEVKEEEAHEQHLIVIEEDREPACWNDSDDDEQIQVGDANRFKKSGNPASFQQYEDKMASLYRKKVQKQSNWAQEGDTIEQKDVNDFLNEEVYYGEHNPTKKVIKFKARTHQKHESVVSGLDWHHNVMFSCGLDHKVKVWSYHRLEENPDLKLRKQKDVYFGDLPLSNCVYRDGQLLAGTLRKNLVLLDCQKWKSTFLTSNFLKEHRSYQNMRASKKSSKVAIFDGMRVSILDHNNVYAGSLLANEQITDFAFNESNEHIVNAVTSDSIYEWDLRKFQACRLEKKYLGFTTLAVNQHSLTVGSKLGTVYIYDVNDLKKEPIQNSNMTTHITQIAQSRDSQIVASISKWKPNAMRVLDVATGRPMGGWPNARTKVGMAMQASFSEWKELGVGSSHGYVSIFGFEEETI